jgi:aromatic ring-opening dioxygenase LigB subunit
MDPATLEEAAECGLRSFQMMTGALDGRSFEAELYSYQGPFGVGYAVASFTPN